MKCFYHKTDLDGICSAAIIKRAYPECELIGVDYTDTLESLDAYTRPGEYIFVVDFSFSLEDMNFLNENAYVTWVDHHKSAIEKLESISGVRGIREIGRAGCELTWSYLHPDTTTPLGVKLLGRYDVWDHADERTLPFQYGMRFYNTGPEGEMWRQVLGNSSAANEKVMRTGEIILQYETQQDEMFAKGMSYEASFEGFIAVVINKAYANSKLFESVYDESKHDIMILFGVKPGEVKYSIYTTHEDIDVSEIAKRYGGGGHKNAAGFFSETLVV